MRRTLVLGFAAVVVLLLVAPPAGAQASSSKPCVSTTTRQIEFDAEKPEELKKKLKENEVIEVCKGLQNIEWTVWNATDFTIQVWPSIYDLPDLPGGPECAPCNALINERAELDSSAIEYDDVVSADGKHGKRARLDRRMHKKVGWFYYKLLYKDSKGKLQTPDPYVIIQPSP